MVSTNKNLGRFLGVFNTPEAPSAAPQVPAAVPATPAPATPEPSVPVSALSAIIDATSEARAREELARARAIQAQAAATPPPAPPAPAAAADEGTEDIAKELRAIKRELAEERRSRAAAELEAYRQHALGAGRAAGLDPAFDLYVGGRNQQEIDASLQVALAEQGLARQRWSQQLAQQHGLAPTQPAPAAPQGTQAPVGYTTQVQPQSPQAPVNAPSMVQAPSPPPQQGLTAEQLAYLVSPAAIRSGEYAANRAAIHQAMKGGMSAPPNGWTFSNQQQPYGVPQAPTPQGAVQQNVYAGVSMPQVRPMGPLLGSPASYQGAPGHQSMGRAVQPTEIDQGAPIDVAASRRAAEASVASARARSGNNQSFH